MPKQPAAPAVRATTARRSLRIATWNINSVRLRHPLIAGIVAALDPDVSINPPWKVSLVYGMPCAVYYQFPAAYYLAARFPEDFESAVLHAVNGGGQNLARAMLTGALAGARVGLAGIPQRLIDGLEDSAAVVALAKAVAAQVVARGVEGSAVAGK